MRRVVRPGAGWPRDCQSDGVLVPDPLITRPAGRISPTSLPVDRDAWGSARAVPELEGPVLVVGAHPDDETIGAGRLVAHLGARHPVQVHVASAGEHCLGSREMPGVADLAAHRLAEWRAAVRALGAQPGTCAGATDGQVGAHAVREWLEALVGQTFPGTLVAPWRLDPHPDHAAVGEAAAALAGRARLRLVEYPIWAPAWCAPDQVRERGWALTAWATDAASEQARDRALACFASQVTELHPGWGPVVPAAALAHHHRQWVCTRASQEAS